MKIVVIGRTHRIRSETIERLRQRGHQAVLPLPQPRFTSPRAAPRDPGHAGRPLREFLEYTAALLRDVWRYRLPQRLGAQNVNGRATAHREDDAR